MFKFKSSSAWESDRLSLQGWHGPYDQENQEDKRLAISDAKATAPNLTGLRELHVRHVHHKLAHFVLVLIAGLQQAGQKLSGAGE